MLVRCLIFNKPWYCLCNKMRRWYHARRRPSSWTDWTWHRWSSCGRSRRSLLSRLRSTAWWSWSLTLSTGIKRFKHIVSHVNKTVRIYYCYVILLMIISINIFLLLILLSHLKYSTDLILGCPPAPYVKYCSKMNPEFRFLKKCLMFWCLEPLYMAVLDLYLFATQLVWLRRATDEWFCLPPVLLRCMNACFVYLLRFLPIWNLSEQWKLTSIHHSALNLFT